MIVSQKHGNDDEYDIFSQNLGEKCRTLRPNPEKIHLITIITYQRQGQ